MRRKAGSSKTLVDISKAYFEGQLCDSDTISHLRDIDIYEPCNNGSGETVWFIGNGNSMLEVQEENRDVHTQEFEEFAKLVMRALGK